MAKIEFKAKINETHCGRKYISVPKFGRTHCDMQAFRLHGKYGSYANSDLFPAMLARIRKETFKDGLLYLDAIPEGVNVDTNKFLAVVSFNV